MKNSEKEIPKHIAFIMDGNGRWAKSRGFTRNKGHEEGAKALKRVIDYCEMVKVEYVTFYAFSTENWKRPKDEIEKLLDMPKRFYNDYRKQTEKERKKVTAKFNFIGKRDKLNKEQYDNMVKIEQETKDNKGINVNIAFDYGSRDEIVMAIKNIIKNKIKPSDINEKLVESFLYTKGIPDVDLLVRTSGEERISNFLLWQISYSEIYFENSFWPDMNSKLLKEIILDYQKRNRRFGGLEREGDE